MNRQTRFVLAVLIAVAAIAAGWKIYRLRHPGFIDLPGGPTSDLLPPALPAPAASPSGTPIPSASPTPAPASQTDSGRVIPPSERLNVQQAVQTCFADQPQRRILQGARDLPSLLSQLEQQDGVRDSTEIENYHLRRPDGREQRLQLLYAEEADRPLRVEMRLYDVDPEGLPVPTDLPAGDSVDPGNERVQAYLRQGQVFFHQVQRHLLLQDGTEAQVEMINSRPRQILVRTAERSMACGEADCRCLE